MKKLLLSVLILGTILTGCSKPVIQDEPVVESQTQANIEKTETSETKEDVISFADYFTSNYSVNVSIEYENGLTPRFTAVYKEDGCFLDLNTGEATVKFIDETDETVTIEIMYGQVECENIVFSKSDFPILKAEKAETKHYGPSGYITAYDTITVEFIEA